jgi:pimeloyl-ACP methyl ester carboxylesterase
MEKFEQDRNMVESGLTKIESIPAELSLNQAGFSSVSGENLPNNDQSILFLQTTALTDENQNIQQLEKTLDIEEVDMENQTTKRTEVNITETENFIVEQQQQTIVSANNRVYSERLRLVTSSVIWNLFSWGQSNESSIEAIEEKMFKAIRVKIERFYVHIRNNSLKMWTVSANTESANIPIVLVHGFCGGVGLWLHNIDALSENRPFYAFDLLGFGRSSRPNFSTDPIVAENQFIESIEDWRKALNLNEIILMGHSFGGYLSASYALKYPQHIKALILADPWGFPEMPMVKPDTPMPLWASFALKCFRYVSPLSLFRMSGQIGVSLFKHLRPDFKRKYMTVLEEPEIVYNYLYHANAFHPR